MSFNPHVQERLYTELTEQLDGMDANSAEYFEKVNTKLPYLDAVIKETLRRNPPVPRLQRRVGIDGYKLAGIPLEKDIEVQISTYGSMSCIFEFTNLSINLFRSTVHHNADYYPDPETFDPERFMPENKHLLVPYTYLPFGQGPRNCIGMRFAYQEMRLCLAKIVREFTFRPSPDTKVPLELSNFNFLGCKDISLNVSRR